MGRNRKTDREFRNALNVLKESNQIVAENTGHTNEKLDDIKQDIKTIKKSTTSKVPIIVAIITLIATIIGIAWNPKSESETVIDESQNVERVENDNVETNTDELIESLKHVQEKKILADQNLITWIRKEIGDSYGVEVTDVYDRQPNGEQEWIYCNFLAQNENVMILGKVCADYRIHGNVWELSYCTFADYDCWENYPARGVDFERVIADLKRKYNSPLGSVEILERDTDLSEKTDNFKIKEVRTINQLNIITIHEMLYGFEDSWNERIGSGIIEQKIDADIIGEWVGYNEVNKEYYYIDVIECENNGKIRVEFSFPYRRYLYSTIQISGKAVGTIDLSVSVPNYLLSAEEIVAVEEEISYFRFWISFDDAMESNKIAVTTGQGNRCILTKCSQTQNEIGVSSSNTTRKEIEYSDDGGYNIDEYDEKGTYIKRTCYNADGVILCSFIYDEYDENGNNTKYSYYNVDGILESYYTLEYDGNGNEIKQMAYNADGMLNGYYIFEYDENDRLVKFTNYNADGSVNWEEVIE